VQLTIRQEAWRLAASKTLAFSIEKEKHEKQNNFHMKQFEYKTLEVEPSGK